MPLEIKTTRERSYSSDVHPTCAEIHLDGKLVAVITARLNNNGIGADGEYYTIKLEVANMEPESVRVTEV